MSMKVPKTKGTFDETNEEIELFETHIIPDTYTIDLKVENGGASSTFTCEPESGF